MNGAHHASTERSSFSAEQEANGMSYAAQYIKEAAKILSTLDQSAIEQTANQPAGQDNRRED